MFLDTKMQNTIAMFQNWAKAGNDYRKQIFFQAAENWKQNAKVLKSLGKPLPEKPAIPMMVEIDVEKAKIREYEFDNGMIPSVDPFIYKPLEVPADIFEFETQTKAPAPMSPVGDPDPTRPNWFNIAPGDVLPAGSVHEDAKGTFVKVAFPSPFGAPYLRWFKIG